MWTYLIAVIVILFVMMLWVTVQAFASLFAREHPEFGPPREEGGGCGLNCRCTDTSACEKSPYRG